MNYQFIVISASEERKQKMIEMFKKIDISNNLIYFLEIINSTISLKTGIIPE